MTYFGAVFGVSGVERDELGIEPTTDVYSHYHIVHNGLNVSDHVVLLAVCHLRPYTRLV